ncbi:acylase [Robiginitalea biformata]|uniref:Penicillin amidase superfamily protein n=1 Tax=Robiginitalea biformata (strain ATCC BAA-864 / DSM 15991 / KCTC 12146 / HTCC2501) TaxID=313596 RepID=A4CHA5_ROBBH|nr:acylase [Robiginitalea biformata]EAR16313.1 Penicillin amidase superfamily protein [Robiginitalea biformata HTCC2501]
MKRFFFCLIASVCLISCEQEGQEARIVWDTYGVPHIYASNQEDLFFMQGWAQMHNHANHILKLYGTSRGRGAEYWGPSKLADDQLIRTMGFDVLAEEWADSQDPELREIYAAFVRGMNAYAEAHPEAIQPENREVLPITPKDVNMHSMYVVFTRFIGGSDLGRVQRWPDMGSNTYAVGPSRSASGNAMLVQNPHLPWFGEFLFFESNLILEGRRMYGTTLVGFPGIAIGFNENLGWSHTDNTIDNSDLYEVELTEGGYLLDGEPTPFQESATTIRVRQEDGSLSDVELPLFRTEHGPVVKRGDDKALTIRMVGMDRPNMFLQWWRMINSSNLEEFENALQMAQIPFWNVMYADRFGDIFYLFNGLVPQRGQDAWAYWDRVVPGGKSADIWTEVHPYEDLPKVKNPANGWLQNANDPPWTSTIPMTLNPDDYPGYMAPRYMPFRPQRSARMLLEDESVTFEELQEYKLSTRLEFADRILDDLARAVDSLGSDGARAAMDHLEAWDRTADAESTGTLLFFNWAQKFGPYRGSNYAVAWDEEAPTTTPDGLADPARAVQLLEASAEEITGKYGTLEVPWGDYYRINYNGKDLPANGTDGSLGVFRVAWPGSGDEDHLYVGGGDSWVGVIEFADSVRAKVLLSYGNATQPGSPHFGDQLELFSRKEFRDAWFTDSAIESNTARVEKLEEIQPKSATE